MAIYDDFLATLPNHDLKEVCDVLRTEICSYPNVRILKKFGLPFFYTNTWVFYFNLIKKPLPDGQREVELCFMRARELPSKELLNFKNRVQIAGLSYTKVADIDLGVLKLLIEESITLDAEKPFSLAKKKQKNKLRLTE